MTVWSFNPRSRTGNDFQPLFSGYEHRRFNPRSRTGNDLEQRVADLENNQFQSTFPHGERRCAGATKRRKKCFNPRSRTGNDGNVKAGDLGGYIVSIHVPARGTTELLTLMCPGCQCFNPRSRTGNDSNHPQISFVLFALTYAIIPINFVQHNLQHAFLLTSPQNHGANPPGILCSLQTRTTLSLRCFLLEITKTSIAPHQKSKEIKLI